MVPSSAAALPALVDRCPVEVVATEPAEDIQRAQGAEAPFAALLVQFLQPLPLPQSPDPAPQPSLIPVAIGPAGDLPVQSKGEPVAPVMADLEMAGLAIPTPALPIPVVPALPIQPSHQLAERVPGTPHPPLLANLELPPPAAEAELRSGPEPTRPSMGAVPLVDFAPESHSSSGELPLPLPAPRIPAPQRYQSSQTIQPSQAVLAETEGKPPTETQPVLAEASEEPRVPEFSRTARRPSPEPLLDNLAPKPALLPPMSPQVPREGATHTVAVVPPQAPAAPILFTPPPPPPMETPPLPQLSQVEGGLRWMLKGGVHEAHLQLHPESLGQVSIHLRVEAGEVHARMWITEPGSVQAIQEGRPHLELSLKEQGLQLGSFDLQQGHRPFQEARVHPLLPERPLPETIPARQEAPEAPAPSPLNPHRIEFYA